MVRQAQERSALARRVDTRAADQRRPDAGTSRSATNRPNPKSLQGRHARSSSQPRNLNRCIAVQLTMSERTDAADTFNSFSSARYWTPA